MRTRFAGKTDVGLQREHNEDNLLLMKKFRLMAVADGMGGHRSGDVASELAVSTLNDFFTVTVEKDATWPFPINPELTDEENYLLTALRLANRRIFDQSLRTSADFGMGTTIVAAMFSLGANSVAIAHVGDSRCYRIREGEITQLTRDHSLVSDAAHMAPWMTPEEMAQLPPNVITRALGIREDVLVDILSEETQPGDIYLLCSDGLSGLVPDEQILEIASSDDSLERQCELLVERANMYGGPDNITVMLAVVEPGEPDDEQLPKRKLAAPPASVESAREPEPSPTPTAPVVHDKHEDPDATRKIRPLTDADAGSLVAGADDKPSFAFDDEPTKESSSHGVGSAGDEPAPASQPKSERAPKSSRKKGKVKKKDASSPNSARGKKGKASASAKAKASAASADGRSTGDESDADGSSSKQPAGNDSRGDDE